MTHTAGSPPRAELIIEGMVPMAFERLEDAMEIGRNLHRAGEEVIIEVVEALEEPQAEQRIGWRYEAESDEWFRCEIPTQP